MTEHQTQAPAAAPPAGKDDRPQSDSRDRPERPADKSGRDRRSALLPVPTPTLGGGVLWGDVLLGNGYRIQHRVGTEDECRLLSPGDMRLASGTRRRCQDALSELRQRESLSPPSGHAVVHIHGILRSSRSMGRITAAVRKAGLVAERFDYPSTRVPIEESADYLARVIENFPPSVTKISFVAHSMGGLVVRTYLQRAGRRADPRLHRLVMIATPNHGANLATMFADVAAFKMMFGPAGPQLCDGEGPAASLPTPGFEFAVIAGTRGSDQGFNPLVPGDDDGTVSLESAKLVGASDFMTVRGLHSTLMLQPSVVEATTRFLTSGALREDGVRRPIVAE